MNLAQLEKRVMYLEFQYQKFLMYHKYIGKNSPVQKLHDELNGLWKEISHRHREFKSKGNS